MPKKLAFTRPSALEDLGAAIIHKSQKNSAKGTTDLRVAVEILLYPIWRFPNIHNVCESKNNSWRGIFIRKGYIHEVLKA